MIRCLFPIVLFFCLFGCTPSITFLDGICFTNVTIIDAEQGQIDDMTVIVQKEKIVKVIKSKDIKLSDTNTIIDASGKFLVPGLWDAHVHFAYIEELAPSMFDLFLAYGITSVRDTGGKIDFVKKWKDLSLANPASAPRVMIAGPLLDGMPNVYNGSTPQRPPLSVGAGSVEEAVKIVDDLVAKGVDLIKAYEMLTPEQFEAVCARAKENGLKVTGHVPLSMDVASAAKAGMNSMEHLRNVEMSSAADSEELLEERRNMLAQGAKDEGGVLRARIHAAQRTNAVINQSQENVATTLEALKKYDVWQIPTLTIMTGISRRPFSQKEWRDGFKYLPKVVADDWNSGVDGVNELEITDAQKTYEAWVFDMVQKMNKEGIEILAGTDCPIFFLTPGRSLHEELIYLRDAGMSTLEVLASATSKPAEYFNLQDQIGLVKEGMIADLLLLDKNPLEDIENTQSINTVIKNGAVYGRSDLDDILDKLEIQE